MSLRNIAIAVVVLVALTAAGVAVARIARPTVEQPIAFNHRLHIEDLGNECVDCHLYARTGVRATIPNLDVCAFCHEETQGDSAEEAKLVEYITSGEKVPWKKVYRVPDHVYFSHRRHTSIAGLDCTECHGVMAEMTEAVDRPALRVTMDRCMNCHDEKGVSNDCLQCHK